MGCFAGCIAYFVRGTWFSPKNERFYGGILLLKRRAPILGGSKHHFISLGSFALWGGLFSMTDCALIHLRNKEDYLNPIAAGFFTGGFLAIRGIQYSVIGSWCQSCPQKRHIRRYHLGNDSIGRGGHDKIPNEDGNVDDVEDAE